MKTHCSRLFAALSAKPSGVLLTGCRYQSALLLASLVLAVTATAAKASSATSMAVTPVQAALPADAQLTIDIGQAALADWLAPDAEGELLGQGYQWAEGPVPEPDSDALLFSDVPANTVYRYHPASGVQPYLLSAGGRTPADSANRGANGLLFLPDGRLLLAQHGDRQIGRYDPATPQLAPTGVLTHFQHKRFNSPNDLVQAGDGSLLFTDPPYGLAGGDKSPAKQLPFNGVYQQDAKGQLHLLTDQLSRPNGLALSPDQQWLYVTNSDPTAAQIWRLKRDSDGLYRQPQLWLDLTPALATGPGLPDGLKVLPNGWVLSTGPGGVWILNADAKVLGRIHSKVAVANLAWHARTGYLYLTASQYLLRLPFKPKR
jgi:gluconolactonase